MIRPKFWFAFDLGPDMLIEGQKRPQGTLGGLGSGFRLGEGNEALESQIVTWRARAIHRCHEWSAAGARFGMAAGVLACSVADR